MKKIIILIVIALLLCGCEKEECEKYKEVDSVCSSFMTITNGKNISVIPISIPCKKKICVDKENKE